MRVFAALVAVVLVSVALLVASPVSQEQRPDATSSLGPLPNPDEVYNPVVAGERLPVGFRQLLPRDAILPVYEPQFVPAAESGWTDDSLVIGLDLDGQSRAYPVGFLNRREMVIDSVAGIPVLVTW